MTDTLVTFPTAKLAMLKGFNEPCNYHYSYGNGDKEEPKNGVVYIGGFLDKDDNNRKYTNSELDSLAWGLPYGNFTAPTQSLLQKWLREIHNIHIMIYCPEEKFSEEHHYYDKWAISISVINDNEKFFKEGYDSYEEALELALQEALELVTSKKESS